MPKAYVFTRSGGPEVEAFVEQEAPTPGPGELLVAVRAAGVNPVDWKLRNGYTRPGSAPPQYPAVFGSEAAGVVEQVGPGVEGFEVGDAVFGNPLTGGYAEYTLLRDALGHVVLEGAHHCARDRNHWQASRFGQHGGKLRVAGWTSPETRRRTAVSDAINAAVREMLAR